MNKIIGVTVLMIMLNVSISLAQWNTVDIGNSTEITLFEHTGSSTPVPFNLRKSGYVGSSLNYGLLHLDMQHNVVGGGANLHFRLLNSNNSFKEYGGLGAYIIKNTAGDESGGLTFYTTYKGGLRKRRVTILDNGNMGVGTTAPYRKFHVLSSSWDNKTGGGVILENTNAVGAGLSLKPLSSLVANGTNGWAIYAGGPNSAVGDGNFGIWAHGTNQAWLSINRNGKVGVGINNPVFKLDVAGTIRATEIKVEAQTADFVFEEDYQLRSLKEVEQFVQKNKHLPDIPSAKQMEEDGVGLAEMNKFLLQKVEELTLYLIEVKKEVKDLKEELNKRNHP
jgi:hypothetical protein